MDIEKRLYNDEQLLIKVVSLVKRHDDLIQMLSQDYAERLEKEQQQKNMDGVECQ